MWFQIYDAMIQWHFQLSIRQNKLDTERERESESRLASDSICLAIAFRRLIRKTVPSGHLAASMHMQHTLTITYVSLHATCCLNGSFRFLSICNKQTHTHTPKKELAKTSRSACTFAYNTLFVRHLVRCRCVHAAFWLAECTLFFLSPFSTSPRWMRERINCKTIQFIQKCFIFCALLDDVGDNKTVD